MSRFRHELHGVRLSLHVQPIREGAWTPLPVALGFETLTLCDTLLSQWPYIAMTLWPTSAQTTVTRDLI